MRALLFGFMASALLVAACEQPGGGEPGATGTTGLSEYRATLMSDEDAITSEVEANLLAIPEIEHDVASGRIDVDTDGGTVTLEGEVGSQAEKESAVSMAWSVAGVTEVKDRLSVEHQ